MVPLNKSTFSVVIGLVILMITSLGQFYLMQNNQMFKSFFGLLAINKCVDIRNYGW